MVVMIVRKASSLTHFHLNLVFFFFYYYILLKIIGFRKATIPSG